MATFAPSPTAWNRMPPSTEPVVVIVGDTTSVRQWVALLRQHHISTESVRSGQDFPPETEAPGCVLLLLTSDHELDGLRTCARWMASNDERPGVVVASSPEIARLLKRLTGKRLQVFDATELADSVAEHIRSAIAADAERRRRRTVWNEIAKRFQLLTAKDRDVLHLLQLGKSNKMIALQLSITERAVEMRRASLMKKLRTKSHAELIRLVTQYEVFAGFDLPLPIE